MNSIQLRHTDKFPEPEFSNLARLVFADVQQPSQELEIVLRDEASRTPARDHGHSPMFRLGAYQSDALVGWTCGWMDRGNVFYMANSGVLPAYRRQGIYALLLASVREHAVAQGAIAMRSQHSVLNNSVLIAKLKAGFHVSGLSQSAQMGTLVELTLHLSPGRQDLYRSRSLPYVLPPT